MDLLPGDEQTEIINTVRAQLEADFDLRALAERDWAPSVIDDSLWARCAELGWFSLGLDESFGGIGYGLAEETLLFEQIGAHATPGPFLATVLAVHVAAACGETELVNEISAGTTRVALAEPDHGELNGVADRSGTPQASVRSGGGQAQVRVRVTDFGGAELLLLLDGTTASLINATGIDLEPQVSFDPLVPLAVATLDLPTPPGHPDGSGTSQSAAVAGSGHSEVVRCSVTDPAVALRSTVLGAAELSGIAQATATQSSEYAKDREQFGRPVGSFQAVKHRCADMAVRADAAVQLTRLASLAVAGGHDDASFQAEAARVVAADAAVINAETNVQNHGGIGFTYEHSAHRYVTRARVRANTAGDRAGHLSAMLAAQSPT